VAPGDKLSLGLGIDPGIQVTSDPVRTRDENRGSSLLGTETRRRAVTARCVVRNVKKVAVVGLDVYAILVRLVSRIASANCFSLTLLCTVKTRFN
jgi:hypothetical protein